MPESQARDIYAKGGWVLRDGTILPQTCTHSEMAQKLGYADYWALCRAGGIAVIRAAPDSHGYSKLLFLRVHALDDATKSRLRDFISMLPPVPKNDPGLFLEWSSGYRQRAGEAFKTNEEAIEWLERSTAGGATPHYVANF